MSKKLKIVLDAIGLIISATSLSLLLYQEKYVAGCLIILISFVFILLVIIHLRSTPLAWESIHFYYEILDPSGKKAQVQKVKKFFVKENNVTTLIDSGISASGRLNFLRSNIGRIIEITDQGGNTTVCTLLSTPLKRGTIVEHIIEYEVIDSFLNQRESVTLNVNHKCCVGLHIRFPRERLPKSINGYGYYEDIVSDLTAKHLNKTTQEYSLVLNKPEIGGTILIEWEW